MSPVVKHMSLVGGDDWVRALCSEPEGVLVRDRDQVTCPACLELQGEPTP